ncbi:MAG: hypothetical protein LUD77_00120 [Clostridiales bacterium]|nr:hypothetical protein [Clostridiales bacterium]
MGGFYFYNTGIKKYKNQDSEETVKWYRESYSRGCDEAKEALVKLDRAAAEKGDAYAQYELAKLITPDLSVPANVSDAQEYCKKFCEEHKSEYEESARWLKMAVEQGQKDALFELGKRYRWGNGGVKLDHEEAKKLLAEAYELGVKEAFD